MIPFFGLLAALAEATPRLDRDLITIPKSIWNRVADALAHTV
jgi:hypothetical protein